MTVSAMRRLLIDPICERATYIVASLANATSQIGVPACRIFRSTPTIFPNHQFIMGNPVIPLALPAQARVAWATRV